MVFKTTNRFVIQAKYPKQFLPALIFWTWKTGERSDVIIYFTIALSMNRQLSHKIISKISKLPTLWAPIKNITVELVFEILYKIHPSYIW